MANTVPRLQKSNYQYQMQKINTRNSSGKIFELSGTVTKHNNSCSVFPDLLDFGVCGLYIELSAGCGNPCIRTDTDTDIRPPGLRCIRIVVDSGHGIHNPYPLRYPYLPWYPYQPKRIRIPELLKVASALGDTKTPQVTRFGLLGFIFGTRHFCSFETVDLATF